MPPNFADPERPMTIRLAVFDLDGTLLNSCLQIQPESLEAIRWARAQGVEVMLASGRHQGAIFPYWKELGLTTPVICSNGACLYDFTTRRTLAHTALTKAQARQVLALLRKHQAKCMLYADEIMAFEEIGQHRARLREWAAKLPPDVRVPLQPVEDLGAAIEAAEYVLKFDTFSDDKEAMKRLAHDVDETTGLACEWSSDAAFDIIQTGISKGARLLEWIASQGLKKSDVLVFGDHYNDLDMFRMAGTAVAMGNAVDAVKSLADWVTGNHNDSGIADGLRRFVTSAG